MRDYNARRGCSSHSALDQRIYTHLQLSGIRNGWSEHYVGLLFELLTCHDTDYTEHIALLEELNAEADRMRSTKS